jgi:hypothetical protein
MTVREYLNSIILMVKNNPEIENYEVVYARDDEGNQFDKVIFTPTLMQMSNINDSRDLEQVYIAEDSVMLPGEDYNAMCIN